MANIVINTALSRPSLPLELGILRGGLAYDGFAYDGFNHDIGFVTLVKSQSIETKNRHTSYAMSYDDSF